MVLFRQIINRLNILCNQIIAIYIKVDVGKKPLDVKVFLAIHVVDDVKENSCFSRMCKLFS